MTLFGGMTEMSDCCENKADWIVFVGPWHDSYTHSCTRHLPYMIEDVDRQELIKIDGEFPCCYCGHTDGGEKMSIDAEKSNPGWLERLQKVTGRLAHAVDLSTMVVGPLESDECIGKDSDILSEKMGTQIWEIERLATRIEEQIKRIHQEF